MRMMTVEINGVDVKFTFDGKKAWYGEFNGKRKVKDKSPFGVMLKLKAKGLDMTGVSTYRVSDTLEYNLG